MTAWRGGLCVRRTEWGQTPIVDFLCTRCGTHKRVTGRLKVIDFMRANPLADHQAHCKPKPNTQGAQAA